jgi:hypothetical protein
MSTRMILEPALSQVEALNKSIPTSPSRGKVSLSMAQPSKVQASLPKPQLRHRPILGES